MSNALVNGLAGAGGGIIAQIITYPLQTVNTRQQTERVARKGVFVQSSDPPNSKAKPAASGGTLMQILQVIKTEGWGGLYSGLKPSLLGTAASQGIYYYFYQVFRNKAEAVAVARKKKGLGDGTVGMFSWLVVAAIAGCLNVLLTNPIWVLVTRMQTHTQAEKKIMEGKREAILRETSEHGLSDLTTVHDKLVKLDLMKPCPYGTVNAVQEVYREAGITGFWKGIIPTLIMVCNPSIQFMIYESSLKHLKAKRASSKHGLRNVTALEVFLLGAFAKLGATVSTYPLLVVKSRLQAKQEIGGSTALRYTGSFLYHTSEGEEECCVIGKPSRHEKNEEDDYKKVDLIKLGTSTLWRYLRHYNPVHPFSDLLDLKPYEQSIDAVKRYFMLEVTKCCCHDSSAQPCFSL